MPFLLTEADRQEIKKLADMPYDQSFDDEELDIIIKWVQKFAPPSRSEQTGKYQTEPEDTVYSVAQKFATSPGFLISLNAENGIDIDMDTAIAPDRTIDPNDPNPNRGMTLRVPQKGRSLHSKNRLLAKALRWSRHYQQTRFRAYKSLNTLFKGALACAGRPIGQKTSQSIVGRHGTNIVDIADLCIEMQLGFDFVQQAKQYDNLRPENYWEVEPEFQAQPGQSDQERKEVHALDKRLKSNAKSRYVDQVAGARGRAGETRAQSSMFTQSENWIGAAQQVRDKATQFLNNVQGHIFTRFDKVYPPKYIDFLKSLLDREGSHFYTSSSASPVSVGNLGRIMHPSEGNQSGNDLYHNIKIHAVDAAARVYSYETDDRSEVLNHIRDVLEELNSELGVTVASVFLEDVDDSCSPDQIRDGFRRAITNDFILAIGRKILNICGKDYKGTQSARVEGLLEQCTDTIAKIRFGVFRFEIRSSGYIGQVDGVWFHNNADTDTDGHSVSLTDDPEIIKLAWATSSASKIQGFSQEDFYEQNKLPEVSGSQTDQVIYIFNAPNIQTGEPMEFSAAIELQEYVARKLPGQIIYADENGRLETDDPSESTRAMLGLRAFKENPGYGLYYSWYTRVRKYRTQNANVLGDLLVDAVQSDNPEEAIAAILPIRVTIGSGSDNLDEAARDLANKYYKNTPTKSRPGIFLTAAVKLENGEAEFIEPEWVRIFFTARDRSSGFDGDKDYQNFINKKPWPNYAKVDGSFDPEKPVKISYSLEGERKTEIVKAGDIYAYGLDDPNWTQRGISDDDITSKVSDLHIESTREAYDEDADIGQEKPSPSDEIIFYTTPGTEAGPDTYQCSLCTVDAAIFHPNSHKADSWDSRLTMNRGRKPGEQIKISYLDPVTGSQTAIIRRHELFDRADELVGNESMPGKIGKNLKIFPVVQEGGAAFYIIRYDKLEAKRYTNMEMAVSALKRMIESQQRADSRLEHDQQLTDEDNDIINTILPDSVGESIDYGDRSVLDTLNTQTKYYDPVSQMRGGFDNISSSQNEKAENTYRKITNGEIEMVDPAIRSRLWAHPENVVRNQPWLHYENGDVQIVIPISPEFNEKINDLTIVDDSDPREFMDGSRFWRLPVERDKHGFLTVKYPWVHKNNAVAGEGGSDRFSGEQADRGTTTVFARPLKVPLKDTSEIGVSLKRRVNKKNKKPVESSYNLTSGTDFRLEPEGNKFSEVRQFVWLGQLKINDELTELTQSDVIEIDYPDSIGPQVFSTLNIPFSKAIDLARTAWGDFELSRKVKSTMRKSDLKFDLDINGLGWVNTVKGDVRAQSMVAELLQDGASAKRFKETHGDFTCGNPISGGTRGNKESPGLARTDSCPNSAVHERAPRVLIQTKRAKVVLRDRSEAFSRLRNDSRDAMSTMRGTEADDARLSTMVIEPQWDWISGSAQIYRDNSDDMEDYFPGEGRKAALQMAKEAEESDDWVSDATIGTGPGLGGICHPCWMSHYQIIPASIIQSMWNDLSEVGAISKSYLGGKTQDQIESLGSGYESDSEKGEESKIVKVQTSSVGGEGEDKVGWVVDWYGQTGRYEFIREEVIPTFLFQDWVEEWFATRKNSNMNNKGQAAEDGDRVYRIVLTKKRANYKNLLKFISKAHEDMGLKKLAKLYDPDWVDDLEAGKYAKILEKGRGYTVKWNKDAGQGVLIIAFDTEVGPRDNRYRVYHDVRDYNREKYERAGERPNYYINDTVVHIPEAEFKSDISVEHTSGKGYEQFSGRIESFSQITLADGTPMVGVIQRQDANEVTIKFYEDGELGKEKVFSRDDIGTPTKIDIKGIKLLIQEKLAEFYSNYLSNTSFWWKIRAYLIGLEGMQNNQKIRLINRLKQWHSQFLEEYRQIVDPKDALIDAGMSDRDIPFFSKAIQRLMSFVGNIYFWTQYLKRRYGNRSALDENDPTIIPLMQLENPEVRSRQSYYAALNDTNPLPPKYSLKNYHKDKINQEDRANNNNRRYTRNESKSRNSVVITSVHDARYLNGLTGIVESIYNNYYVVTLNENNLVKDEQVLLVRNEFAYIYGDPNPPLTEAKIEDNDRIEYQKLAQEEVDAEQSKDELIELISEFTSEYPFWD